MKKLVIIIAKSASTPNTKNGMVNLTGIAARLVITTAAREAIAAMISPNAAPFNKTTVIVKGKNTAAIAVMAAPTQAT